MSSKGTIFLTKSDEHVYDETNDWSIVFEINRESIDRVEMNVFNDDLKKFEVKNIEMNFEYLIISTIPHYDFLNSFKTSVRNFDNCLRWLYNNLDCLNFEEWEISEFTNESIDLKIPYELRIFLNKESEWFKEYVKALKKYLAYHEDKIKLKKQIIRGKIK